MPNTINNSKNLTLVLYVIIYVIYWRRKWQPNPVFLPGESQGQRSLVDCCLWGCTESDTTINDESYRKGYVEPSLILLKFSLAELRCCPWGQLWAASSSFKATRLRIIIIIIIFAKKHSFPIFLWPSLCELLLFGEMLEGQDSILGERGVLGRSLLCPGSAKWIPLQEWGVRFYDDPQLLCQDCQPRCPAVLITMRTSVQ